MQQRKSESESRKSRVEESEEQSLECRETLNQPIDGNKVRHCCCKCNCRLQEAPQDPVEKKRQKRKQSKKRQKQRQKAAKEKALIALERIIRNIYALQISFRKAQVEVQECLLVENNRERLCQFINMVIRDQVEFIRKEIAFNLKRYDPLPQGKEHEAVKAVFLPIQRIAEASIEIEKLINIFMANFSEEQEIPLQKNFGRTTLKYLVKADLSKSGVFSAICSHIFKEPPELYQRQRELIDYMTNAMGHYSPSHFRDDSSESEEDTEEYYDDDEDDWEEISTIESPKNQLEERELDVSENRGKKKKREKRRKLKEEFQSDFEVILKRTEEMAINNEYRSACNVSEQCLERLKRRRQQYALLKQ